MSSIPEGTPLQDYALIEVQEKSSNVMKTEDIRDRKERGIVISVGPGVYDQNGKLIKTTLMPGDVVYWEEAAEANTPRRWRDRDHYMIRESRIMYKEAATKDDADVPPPLPKRPMSKTPGEEK